jgi:hypothetical protein
MGEHALDAALRSFMAQGAEAPAQRIADRAMTQVRTTPQVRRSFRVRRASGPWPVRAAAAALLLSLAVGVAAYVTPRLVGPGAPAATVPARPPASAPVGPSANADPAPRLVTVGSEAVGYTMLVPVTWEEVPSGFTDARRWVGPDGELMVSYGASIFNGGQVTACGPPTPEWPLCMTQEFTYSVPYDPEVDGVAPLSFEGFVRDRCLGGCDVTVTETTLGGEMAEQNRTVAAGQRVTYVSTFHGRRPVIVYWSEPESAADRASLIDQMRASFRFLDTPTASPTPSNDPTELIPYVDTDLGYEVLIPRFWGEGTADASYPGVHEFGSGRGFGTRGHPALTISVGSRDGTVALCQGVGHVCEEVVAATVDELDRRLISRPTEGGGPLETSGELQLAGEPGRFKRPGYRLSSADAQWGIGATAGGNCLGCPGMLYHAYTVKDGRPIVLSFDWWTIAFEELSPDYVREILSSFRLLA